MRKVEDLVNDWIHKGLSVLRVEMPREEAEKIGAQMEFGAKYPDVVSVYFMGEKSAIENQDWNSTETISKEFCGGPHVENTKELEAAGKQFKILAQENSGAGVKRIKAGLVAN